MQLKVRKVAIEQIYVFIYDNFLTRIHDTQATRPGSIFGVQRHTLQPRLSRLVFCELPWYRINTDAALRSFKLKLVPYTPL